MITQIYGITCVEDAVATTNLGVDRIGLVVCEDAALTPDGLTLSEGRHIKEAVSDDVTVCMLTFSEDADEILRDAMALEPHVVHLSRTVNDKSVELLKELLDRNPALQVMQAVSVIGPESVETARQVDPYVESLILDTPNSNASVIGASGTVHDWAISRQIVEQCHSPVILAGGISPENVQEAIQAVRPWGVDSFSQTSFPDNLRRKDLRKVERFIANARRPLN